MKIFFCEINISKNLYVFRVTVSLHFIHLLMVSLYFQCIYLQCVGIFHSLQEIESKSFEKYNLPIPTITKEGFDGYDTNNDEILTWKEYQEGRSK